MSSAGDTSARSESGSEISGSQPRGRIERIEVDNFKSYRGHQVIGPFRNFTAVIGPNGAGKSNLMDCISFVLAVRTVQLRGTHLKDLIYKVEGETQARTAWVKMVYKHGLDGEEETEFYRGISSTGTSEFKVDGKAVSLQQYEKSLATIGVLVKVRNFLVFQGEVETLAQTSPAKLTELFEKISGSGALKEEYETLKAEKERGEEDAIFSLQKKKGLQSEKKQVAQQKEEAEKYENLKAELDKVRSEMHLFDLYYNEREISAAKEKVAVLQEDLDDIVQRREATEAKMKDAKKEAAVFHREQIAGEKELVKHAVALDKEKSTHIKLTEEVSFLSRKVERLTKSVQQADKEAVAHQTERVRVEEEIEDVEGRLEELRSSPESQEELELGEEQMKQYARLKEKADAQTFADRQELEAIEREQQMNRQELQNLTVGEGEARHRMEQAEKQLQDLRERLGKLDGENKQRAAALQQKQTKLTELEDTDRNNVQLSQQYRNQLDKIHEQLRDAKMDRREEERNAKRAEMVTMLKQVFPGVHGRICDLCKPSNRKFNVAVTVAVGKDTDSIVVDTEQVALQCVEYLSHQQAGVATFIPLDTIKVKQIDDSLRTLGGSSKLVIDIVDFDRKFERALLYVCGATLVFDTIEEARQVCLMQQQRYRGVTLDGTKIEKSGIMTGGISGVETQAMRWDQGDLDRLKKERDEYEKKLMEVSREHVSAHIQTLSSEVQGLSKAMQYASADIKELNEKIKAMEKIRLASEKQVNDATPKIVVLQGSMATRDQKLSNLKEKIGKQEDKIFASFSKEVGVHSIREYESKILLKRTERSEEIGKLSTQLSLLRSKLEYELSRDRVSMDKGKAELDKLRDALRVAEAKEIEQRTKVGEKEDLVKDRTHRVRQIKDQRNTKEVDINAIKKDLDLEVSKERELRNKMSNLERNLERHRAQRLATLRACKMEDISIPLITPEGDEPVPLKKRKRGRERIEQSATSESFSESQITSGETQESAGGSLVQIDFSGLPETHLEIDKDDYEEKKSEYQKRIQGLGDDINKINPNMKASEKLDDVANRLKMSDEEFGMTRLKAKDATAKFAKVKERRYKLFMRAFNHISKNIDHVYKELTKTPGANVGGTAYLTLENPDEPYLAGIKYNAMPPMKRFRDMDQLSGGEKTVAAVALLFAIHSFHPSPFFVLDEVDAALDQANVNKVANYISSRSGDLQCIVISLKDTFYEKAQSLVGIYRDQTDNCSKTLSLDLAQYA